MQSLDLINLSRQCHKSAALCLFKLKYFFPLFSMFSDLYICSFFEDLKFRIPFEKKGQCSVTQLGSLTVLSLFLVLHV